MAKCIVTGKRKQTGCNVSHANNRTKRWMKANLQKVKVILDSGEVKHVWVSSRALKSGLVKKAPHRKSVLASLGPKA